VAEPLKPVGFWSYTSSDDEHSGGRLSALRLKLAGELQLRIGRQPKVHIFQDVAAIPHGTDWLKEINRALDGSSFLLPIVTPAFLQSDMCCHEVMRFRQREENLGRDDLIFPFLYIDVSDIEAHEVHDPSVLALLKSRQWINFAPLRYRPADSEEVATKLGGLAVSIRAALRRPSPSQPGRRWQQRRCLERLCVKDLGRRWCLSRRGGSSWGCRKRSRNGRRPTTAVPALGTSSQLGVRSGSADIR
jgi:hypothetical protein